MTREVLLFASAREAAGADRVSIDLPEGATAADLLERLGEAVPALRAMSSGLLVSDGQSYVGRDATLTDGGELAVFPPVAGG